MIDLDIIEAMGRQRLAAVALSVMTSSSGILCTGEKKCIPTNRPGSGADWAIRVIEMVDVLIVGASFTSVRLTVKSCWPDRPLP